MEVFLRTPFNYDRDQASFDSGLACLDGSRTQQEFADECDINTIVRMFGLTGEVPATVATPMQGDFTGVVDYQSALNLIIQADTAFSELPAETRKYFDNDPAAMLDFVSDPANLEKAREMGLCRPVEVPPEPLSVRVVPEVPAA